MLCQSNSDSNLQHRTFLDASTLYCKLRCDPPATKPLLCPVVTEANGLKNGAQQGAQASDTPDAKDSLVSLA